MTDYIPRYARDKTVLRGRIHQIACYISIIWLAIYLLNVAYKAVFVRKKSRQKKILQFEQIQNDTSKEIIYGTISKILILSTQAVLYGCSSLYHLNNYNKWLQKLDHFCIFLFISSVHTSVLLGMKKKKKMEKKKINLPTANELLFKLHPNPFSINSPMRNSKDGKQDIDLSQSKVSLTSESNTSFFVEHKNPFVQKTITKEIENNETFEKSDDKKRDILESSFFDSSFPNMTQDRSRFDLSRTQDRSRLDLAQDKSRLDLAQDRSRLDLAQDKSRLDLAQDRSRFDLSRTQDKSRLDLAQDRSRSDLAQDKSRFDLSRTQDKSQLDPAGPQSDKTTDLSVASTLSSTGSYDDETTTEIERTQNEEEKSDESSSSFDPSLDTTVFPTEISLDDSVKKNSVLNGKSEEKDDTQEDTFYRKQDCTKFLQKQEVMEIIPVRWPLSVTWAFCLFGFLKIMIQKEINELIDVPIYILHGLHFVFTCQFKMFPKTIVSSFILGGFCYILGGILFGLEFPNFDNKIFGFHEFFHVMTVLGNTCFLVPIIFNWELIE
ncbi:hemolysin III-like putative integral membrane protein [Pseudoloma neurophilia]|uniref:Hemolysin III-like putative integral membrane protein n=1 Tax=Pseudoloma neurophilia TaxID=146866 RepID=A0A0R0M3E8_9MICR|nr:hemolysin III-like putative integral membrane protein [Pseudoloma neurophilia]